MAKVRAEGCTGVAPGVVPCWLDSVEGNAGVRGVCGSSAIAQQWPV